MCNTLPAWLGPSSASWLQNKHLLLIPYQLSTYLKKKGGGGGVFVVMTRLFTSRHSVLDVLVHLKALTEPCMHNSARLQQLLDWDHPTSHEKLHEGHCHYWRFQIDRGYSKPGLPCVLASHGHRPEIMKTKMRKKSCWLCTQHTSFLCLTVLVKSHLTARKLAQWLRALAALPWDQHLHGSS
jgi:hypothetical protein